MSRQQVDPKLAIRALEAVRRKIAEVTDDEDAIRDTLEGEIDLDSVFKQLILEYREQEAVAGANKTLADLYTQRQRAAEAKASTLKGLILYALDAALQKGWKTPVGSVSRVEGREGLEVVDLDAIPALYLVPQPPKPDRKTLLALLQSGAEVPGCELKRGDPYVTVR